MSRIGRTPIAVPSGVTVTVAADTISVKGSKGTLTRSVPNLITVREDGGVLVVERADDSRSAKALHGLTRTLVSNMVTGVSTGFSKELEIIGVGYRAAVAGSKKLEMSLGFSHPVVVEAPEGIDFETPQPTRIVIKGTDKELVGQVAANIRKIRKPEPYKGKGVRYVGEQVRRKAGKAAKK
jgi:large subunit ribosomal protein L6